MLSRAGERVHVSDLCRAADVSERTLEVRIQGSHGTVARDVPDSTATAPRARRPARCRAWIDTRVDAGAQVGVLALRRVFAGYKQCFGESPSETLRRRPGMRELSSNTVAKR